jgi:hypothetical protein
MSIATPPTDAQHRAAGRPRMTIEEELQLERANALARELLLLARFVGPRGRHSDPFDIAIAFLENIAQTEHGYSAEDIDRLLTARAPARAPRSSGAAS